MEANLFTKTYQFSWQDKSWPIEIIFTDIPGDDGLLPIITFSGSTLAGYQFQSEMINTFVNRKILDNFLRSQIKITTAAPTV